MSFMIRVNAILPLNWLIDARASPRTRHRSYTHRNVLSIDLCIRITSVFTVNSTGMGADLKLDLGLVVSCSLYFAEASSPIHCQEFLKTATSHIRSIGS